MRTKTLKQPSVNIVTMGCSKNTVDSEVLLTQLRGNNIEAHHESKSDNHNIIVINTCGFIDNAKQESIDTILRYAEAKESGEIEKLFVTGCLSHRYRDDLQKEIPEVDAYMGTNELPRLLKLLKADYKKELLGERLLSTPNHSAFFKISEGCDRPCSFCAIPLMRGKHVSKPIDHLLLEAKNLASKGVKELVLIAQDLTYYGLDLYKKRALAELLEKLSEVQGIEWIRLQYAYPSKFPLDILPIIRERENICNYIDMPLQHISNNMLRKMKRSITKERTQDLVNTIRDSVPGIHFRTTILVGHPGETEEDFGELLDFIALNKFERLGVFTYSHEEKTHAGDAYEDDVDEDTKEQRAEELMELQQDISFELNQKKIGSTQKVLFERMEGDYFIGRTEFDSPEVDNEVLISKENYVELGNFSEVIINDAEAFDLYASLK